MKMTLKQGLEMYSAIQALDQGYKDGEKTEQFKYDGATRLKLAMARRRLRELYEDYVESRNKLLLEVTAGVGELPGLDKPLENGIDRAGAVQQHVRFAQAERKMLLADIEIDLNPIGSDSLDLDHNPIPVAVLDLLGDFVQVQTGA
jgi:hypothetical protein